jgi:hypothetical protein
MLIFTCTLMSFLLPSISAQSTHLIAPALVTVNNHTQIQCWNLTVPFTRSSTPGVSGTQALTIPHTANLTYSILPPRYDGGLHNAPVPQIVHFVSGLAHVTLPQDDSVDLWLMGGADGLVFALDTTGDGHITRYPSDQQTVAILVPFEGGQVPEYEVLREGPCVVANACPASSMTENMNI